MSDIYTIEAWQLLVSIFFAGMCGIYCQIAVSQKKALFLVPAALFILVSFGIIVFA